MQSVQLRKCVWIILVAGGFFLAASEARAEENGRTVTGAALYRLHCASCHGESGRGDGLVGAALQPPPGDLTVLTHKHGGIFPAGMIIEFIDGTRDVLAHGPRAMPVWGMVFQNRETIRRIVDYIRDLQQPQG